MLLSECQVEVQSKLAKLFAAFLIAVAPTGVSQLWAQNEPVSVPEQMRRAVRGPAELELSPECVLQVPVGWRFAYPAQARIDLVAKGEFLRFPHLAGILVSDTGARVIQLHYLPTGYVKDTGEAINRDKTLEAIQEQMDRQNALRVTRAGFAPYTNVMWATEPAYDSAGKKLEWAVSAQCGDMPVVNHTVRLLTREGILDVVLSAKATDAEETIPALKKVALDAIQIKEGHRYADFQEKDPVAKVTLANLLTVGTDDERITAIATKDSQASSASTSWILVILGVLSGMIVAFFVIRAVSRRRAAVASVSTVSARAHEAVAPATQASEPVASAAAKPAGETKARLPLVVPSHSNGARKPIIQQTMARAPKPTGNGRVQKKKAFDYNRYFADLMSSVSGHSNYFPDGFAGVAEARETGTNGHSNGNGQTNGNSNGNTTGYLNGFAQPSAAEIQAQMIATQKALIEEQRRLIQEQSKLIEEKSRLIAEKNLILDRQLELIDQKLL